MTETLKQQRERLARGICENHSVFGHPADGGDCGFCGELSDDFRELQRKAMHEAWLGGTVLDIDRLLDAEPEEQGRGE